MTPDEILKAIDALPESERADLMAQLNARYPQASPRRQLEMLPTGSTFPVDLVLTFDGGSRGNPGPAYGSFGLAFAGEKPKITRLEFGSLTNNEAEYQTLIRGVKSLLQKLGEREMDPGLLVLEIRGDSALVINQLKGEWKVKEPRMGELRDAARALLRRFKAVRFTQQPRARSVELLGH